MTNDPNVLPVIPYPRIWEPTGGFCPLKAIKAVRVAPDDPQAIQSAHGLQKRMAILAGDRWPIHHEDGPGAESGTCRIVLEDGLSAEHYRLIIREDGILLTAADAAGLNHGNTTLIQLATNLADEGGEILLPTGTISDGPGFGWRGMLLDCGRHFMDVALIKGVLDRLALHKFNVLHWHLTEDQGWRLEIPGYPQLTEIGAWREGPTGTPYGGFYTAADVREVLAHATGLGITVVPEIEMPGHCLAALAAYPELSCSGGPLRVETQWGIHEDVFCAGREETFVFLEAVLLEVMDLFPGPYVHIGADEVPKDRWRHCDRCQARMKAEGLADEHALQSWFVGRIEKFLAAHGRRLIGWDEILEGDLAGHGSDAIVQAWRGHDRAAAAARQGFAVIVSPTSHAYFDYDPGILDLQKVYAFDPVPEVLAQDPTADRILGGALNLWTEYIPPERVDAMLFPRLLGMAEALWTAAPHRDYPAFLSRVERHRPLLSSLGVQSGPAARPIDLVVCGTRDPVAFQVSCTLADELTEAFGDHDLAVRYLVAPRPTDFVPDQHPENQKIPAVSISADRLDSPRIIRTCDPCLILAQLFVDDLPYGAPGHLELSPRRFPDATLSLTRPPSVRFGANQSLGLVDGQHGSRSFQDGRWYGYEGNDLEAVLDWGEIRKLTSLSVRFIQDANAWVFLPSRVDVQVSHDGETWSSVGVRGHEISDRQQDKIIQAFVLDLAGIEARFLKMIAKNPGPCPDWHPGQGQPTWIFADEITID